MKTLITTKCVRKCMNGRRLGAHILMLLEERDGVLLERVEREGEGARRCGHAGRGLEQVHLHHELVRQSVRGRRLGHRQDASALHLSVRLRFCYRLRICFRFGRTRVGAEAGGGHR